MGFTIHAHNIMLDYEFRNVSSNSFFKTNLYVGLSLSEIDPYGQGVLEPTDINYQRIAIPRTSSSWTSHLNGESVLKVPINFPRSKNEWGNIINLFFSTEEEIGSNEKTILYYKRLKPLTYVGKNTKIVIPKNTIYITD